MPLEILRKCPSGMWKELSKMPDFDEMHQVKIRRGVKKILDCMKSHKRETYDDVISKIIAFIGNVEKEIPSYILKNLDERIDDVNQGRVCSFKDAKKRVF